MLEMVNAIPENVGWVIVGAVGMLTLIVIVKVGKIIVEMIKDRLTNDEENENGD